MRHTSSLTTDHCERTTSRSAFTLIEMSIVVAVIGLLAGGVMVGQSMYRNAKLQEVTVQMNRLGAAVKTFRDTYNAIPGDMSNATSLWGIAGGTGNDVTCQGTDSSALADIRKTCNGNGDGITGIAGATHYEHFRLFQHLSNAGLYTGKFSGVTGSGGTCHYTTANAPVGPLPGSLMGAPVWGAVGGSTTSFMLSYGPTVTIGGASTGGLPTSAIMSPKEVFNIDAKLDDGVPHRGNIIVGNISVCTNGPTFGSPAYYNTPEAFDIAYLQTSKVSCFMYLRNIF